MGLLALACGDDQATTSGSDAGTGTGDATTSEGESSTSLECDGSTTALEITNNTSWALTMLTIGPCDDTGESSPLPLEVGERVVLTLPAPACYRLDPGDQPEFTCSLERELNLEEVCTRYGHDFIDSDFTLCP